MEFQDTAPNDRLASLAPNLAGSNLADLIEEEMSFFQNAVRMVHGYVSSTSQEIVVRTSIPDEIVQAVEFLPEDMIALLQLAAIKFAMFSTDPNDTWLVSQAMHELPIEDCRRAMHYLLRIVPPERRPEIAAILQSTVH